MHSISTPEANQIGTLSAKVFCRIAKTFVRTWSGRSGSRACGKVVKPRLRSSPVRNDVGGRCFFAGRRIDAGSEA
jgi:hypothetical protein